MCAFTRAPGRVGLQHHERAVLPDAAVMAEYGGGFVDELNEILGLHGTVPECMPPQVFAGFVPAGGVQILESSGPQADLAPGTQKVMCCIHPWMRGAVEVK